MGTPNYPKDLASEWNRLRRDVKGAFTSANLRTGMAKIGAKVIEITGQLILNAGAKLIAKYDNNVDAFLVDQAFLDGQPVGRVMIQRYDGTRLFEVFGGPTEPGFFYFKDRNANIIFSDDAVSEVGLARPWIPYNVTRTKLFGLPDDLITSSTYTAVQTIHGQMQHPKMKFIYWPYILGSDVAQYRLRNPDTGTVLYESANLPASAVGQNVTASHENYVFGNDFKYDLEVRRVSGTGSVGATISYAMGRQS